MDNRPSFIFTIIFHYPTEQKDLDRMMRKVAKVHADAVKPMSTLFPAEKSKNPI